MSELKTKPVNISSQHEEEQQQSSTESSGASNVEREIHPLMAKFINVLKRYEGDTEGQSAGSATDALLKGLGVNFYAVRDEEKFAEELEKFELAMEDCKKETVNSPKNEKSRSQKKIKNKTK